MPIASAGSTEISIHIDALCAFNSHREINGLQAAHRTRAQMKRCFVLRPLSGGGIHLRLGQCFSRLRVAK